VSLRPRTFDAVLFDLDGTLVDSLSDIAASVNHVLGELGHPILDLDTIRGHVGDGARSLVERCLPAGVGPAAVDEALVRYQARYRSHLVVHTRPFDGVVPLLGALRSEGVRLAVVTNKPEAPARALVAQLFADGTFELVIGEGPARPKKPSPAPALFAASALGAAPSRTAFVGDSAVDVETGRAAGMTAIGVAWGLRPRSELVAAGAALVAEDVGMLGRHLGLP
jgi:phosphoglycolate phosphatase